MSKIGRRGILGYLILFEVLVFVQHYLLGFWYLPNDFQKIFKFTPVAISYSTIIPMRPTVEERIDKVYIPRSKLNYEKLTAIPSNVQPTNTVKSKKDSDMLDIWQKESKFDIFSYDTVKPMKIPKVVSKDSGMKSGEGAQMGEIHHSLMVSPTKRDNVVQAGEYFKPKPFKVNPHDFRFLKQPFGCEESRPYLLILVLSTHMNIDRRKAIRETWGGVISNGTWPNRPGNFTVRVYFLLGAYTGGNMTMERELRYEARTFRDIIQENFNDTYHNLPKKTIMGLKWATHHCPSSQYVMKTDDDTFINVGPLVSYLMAHKETQNKVIGVYCPRSMVIREGRWGVAKERYPFEKYPPYTAGGPGYIMPTKFAADLFDVSQYVPEIEMEDVYVTGILTKILSIKVARAVGFQDSSRRTMNVCGLNRKSPSVLAIAQLDVDRIRRIWDFVVEGKRC